MSKAPTTRRIGYTIAEVAAMTGRNRSTIWRWREKGILKPVKLPGCRDMISAASLEKLFRVEQAGEQR